MTINDAIPGLEGRRTLYEIDADARATIAELWPLVAPYLDGAIEEFIDSTSKLPPVANIVDAAKIVREHRDAIKAFEMAHFKTLLSGNFDEQYAESCRRTVAQETAVGFDARVRCNVGNCVLRFILDILARGRPFTSAKLVKRVRVVSQIITFDIANAMTLHRDGAIRATQARRAEVDSAIADFSGAIGEVLEAIQEASASLTSTCTNLKSAAGDTLDRVTSASSAFSETAQRVEWTATATEELSNSIQEIGEQASRVLARARSAVADADRAQQAIGSLNEAAERIGSVVDTISAVAGQTNLLALNATIEAARAGEAGRGFAVVASEVKALASQTSNATKDISEQIAAIQAATKGSVNEIHSISHTIGELSSVSTSIASAVEQQSVTTREIAESVQNAASHTVRASTEIDSIKQVAAQGVTSIEDIQTWTKRLSKSANDLEAKVADFFSKVRATSNSNDWQSRAAVAARQDSSIGRA
ncbi:MAG TPA: globin-coupled sensor protein [Xanthobacteraceae bacterium]|jgi:methyl-accepting chemotaxis protein